jgi:cobalt-precorrin 5A hydrolase
MAASRANNLAVWALTPNGTKLAGRIRRILADVDVYLSQNIGETRFEYNTFQKLGETLTNQFERYSGHVFIMSTGIVVRLIAPLIQHKTEDPAVVVVDDGGNHAISLLSGHLGGANELARQIAAAIGARPVITTATDVNQVPAIDILAKQGKLKIENPAAIKTVNMAILKGEKIYVHDPFDLLKENFPNSEPRIYSRLKKHSPEDFQDPEIAAVPGVYIDDVELDLPAQVLVLRPASLAAGIGCNRNTATGEIKSQLQAVLAAANLSVSSLKCLASIDVKADEDGLLALADDLDLPLVFYKRQELNQVKNIENPSTLVEKHVGVKSVCEAAAILATQNGTLIVPKKTTQNVTVAIARINFSSLALVPAVPII